MDSIKIKILSTKVAAWIIQVMISSFAAIGAIFTTSVVVNRFECSYDFRVLAVLLMGGIIFIVTMKELK